MRRLLGLAVLIAIVLASLGTRAGVVFLRQPPLVACILDQLAVKPSAAYALRRLSCSAPFAFQAFRLSDNTLLNIGFVGESLDTATLSSFCSGTVCNISVWYDQTGNGRSEICFGGAASTCALIWNSGAAATIGGKPAGLMNSTYNDWFYTNPGSPDTGIMGTNQGGILAVGNAASGLPGSAGNGWVTVPPIAAVVPNFLSSSNAGLFFIQGGSAFSPPSFIANRYFGVGGGGSDVSIPISYTYGADGVFAMRFNTVDATPNKAYFNGGTPQTDAAVFANAASADFYIGAIPSFPRPFAGKIAEVYVFATEPSLADTNLLGNDMASWFGLTWTNITL